MTYPNSPPKPATVPRINLRVSEFCTAYGIGRTTFYEEVKSGALFVIKVGKRTLIPVTEANRWQEQKIEARIVR